MKHMHFQLQVKAKKFINVANPINSMFNDSVERCKLSSVKI